MINDEFQSMLVWNNQAVEHVEAGNISMAFHLLLQASGKLPNAALERDDTFDYDLHQLYRYPRSGCSHIFQNGISDIKLCQEGCLPFIHKVFIRAYAMNSNEEAGLPLYGFEWVIRLNLATMSCILGTCLGEQGHKLRQFSIRLMEQVQRRLDIESSAPPPRRQHWDYVQLVVLNNQACIARDIGETNVVIRRLDGISNIIASLTNNDIAQNEYKEFILCTQLMVQSLRFASAA